MTGSLEVNGKLKTRSEVYSIGGNGDYVSEDSNGVERWRIWRDNITTASYSLRYRARLPQQTTDLITGYLALAAKPNTRIVFSNNGKFDTILKTGEAGVFFFYYLGSGGLPAIVIGEHSVASASYWCKYNCGDTTWNIVYNDIGSIAVTHGNATVSGIGIIVNTN